MLAHRLHHEDDDEALMFVGVPSGASLVGSIRIASSPLRPNPYQMKQMARLRPPRDPVAAAKRSP